MNNIELNKSLLKTKPLYTSQGNKVYQDGDLLYKIFDSSYDELTIQNKLEKLEIVERLNIEALKPRSIITSDGNVVGYTMNNYKEYKPLNCLEKSKKNKIKVLKRVKAALDQLHDNDIIYGDIDLNNIIEHDNNILIRDIDNANVKNHPFDDGSRDLIRYISKFGLDENLDNYLLNLFTINYIERITPSYCLEFIKNNNLPFILNTKENKEIVDNMVKLKKKDMDVFVKNAKRYHL